MRNLKYLIATVLVAPLLAWSSTNVYDLVKANRLDVDNVRIDGNTISTTNTNGNLTLDMNGTGSVILTDLTASTVPYLDASKKITSSAVTPTELGYLSGVTSAIQTQLSSKLTDPTTSNGDLITRTAGVPARLAIGSNNTVLTSNGSAASYNLLVNANVDAAAAIAYSKLAALTSANILVGSAGNVATVTPVTGDISLTNAGVTAYNGVVPVAKGGTNLASGTSGGVLAYTAAGVLASSGALAANQIVLGGGAGVVPSTLASLGTTTTLLHGNAAGAPTFGAVSLTADVSGVAPIANGGTNNGALAVTAGGVIYSDGSKLVNSGAGTTGQSLVSAGASPPTWGTPTATPVQNFLVNGAFDYWQAGTTGTATNVSGATHTLNSTSQVYVADQWFVSNTLGGGTINGVITFSQVAAVTNGSGFGASVKITTAPTGTGLQNGMELYQVLSNKASLPLYGQTASFNILAKALGNVTQVGCQFFYATSEVKPTVSIGSEQLATVSTGGFTSCTITAQALGTSQTAAGVIGVRIRPTAVSSGNLYDLNNGFVVEQAMLNSGSLVGTFSRQFNNPAQELLACQYFYEKQGGNATSEAYGVATSISGTNVIVVSQLSYVAKRIVPTLTAANIANSQFSNTTNNWAISAVAILGAASYSSASVQWTVTSFTGNISGWVRSTNANMALFWDARI